MLALTWNCIVFPFLNIMQVTTLETARQFYEHLQ